MRRLALLIVVVLAALTGTAAAKSFPESIELSGATSAEGIAAGPGNSFFAGDLFLGDIYRGDLVSGTASLFADVPSGRMAAGIKVDNAHGLLFVAGAFTGQAYVYDSGTGDEVATFQLAAPGSGMINDVAVAGGAAWFTDSLQPHLYRVPIGADGSVGPALTLVVTGPAAALSGDFNLNGIAAAASGKVLIVAHSGDGALYTVDPETGASAGIEGAEVPTVDGIVFEAGRLWAVQNFLNQVTEFRLSPDLTTATVAGVITSDLFQIPTTAARQGSRLLLVNAKFDTGLPPTADSYEVVIVEAR
jgi:sugar lactone lactonase YvrE